MERKLYIQRLTGYKYDWQTLGRFCCVLCWKSWLCRIILFLLQLLATLDQVLTTCRYALSFDSHSKPEGLTVACPFKRRTIKPSRVEVTCPRFKAKSETGSLIIFLCAWVNRTLIRPKGFPKSIRLVVPNSQFIPPPLPSPLSTINLFSLSVTLGINRSTLCSNRWTAKIP